MAAEVTEGDPILDENDQPIGKVLKAWKNDRGDQMISIEFFKRNPPSVWGPKLTIQVNNSDPESTDGLSKTE